MDRERKKSRGGQNGGARTRLNETRLLTLPSSIYLSTSASVVPSSPPCSLLFRATKLSYADILSDILGRGKLFRRYSTAMNFEHEAMHGEIRVYGVSSRASVPFNLFATIVASK